MAENPQSDPGHVPVLAEQVLSLLEPHSGQVCLDCTVGRGGHAALIMPRLAPDGHYIGLDLDPLNVAFCRQRLDQPGLVSVDIAHANFADSRQVLDEAGIAGVDLLLADLGFSSNQMDDPSRGFSFGAAGPLDMRLDPALPTTAAHLVNTLSERELADLLFRFGQERLSRKIARKIVEDRDQSPIKDTLSLAEIVRKAYAGRARSRAGSSHRTRWRIDPATRTFLALRIAVNGELEALQRLIEQLPHLLRPGGVAAIISFHSLEDRLVKQAFAQWHHDQRAQRLTRKVVVPDPAQRRSHRRGRSAKLRAIRWLMPVA